MFWSNKFLQEKRKHYRSLKWLLHLPHQVKTQYLHFRFHANYFLLPVKIHEKISRRSMLFHNYRQYLPYQTYVHTFYYSSGLTRNMMFKGSIYYVSYLQLLRFYLGRQTCCFHAATSGLNAVQMFNCTHAYQFQEGLSICSKMGHSLFQLIDHFPHHPQTFFSWMLKMKG